MASSTTDHETIRNWVHQRGGVPATVKATTQSTDDIGLLRIDFPHGQRDDKLSTISWDDFFDKFEAENLAFLYEEETSDSSTSRFCKFIRRDS
ncbi:MAG: hypothetical protein R3C05_16320 [Pirellulaceae bacterium]